MTNTTTTTKITTKTTLVITATKWDKGDVIVVNEHIMNVFDVR